jgi:hypothetical protein
MLHIRLLVSAAGFGSGATFGSAFGAKPAFGAAPSATFGQMSSSGGVMGQSSMAQTAGFSA